METDASNSVNKEIPTMLRKLWNKGWIAKIILVVLYPFTLSLFIIEKKSFKMPVKVGLLLGLWAFIFAFNGLKSSDISNNQSSITSKPPTEKTTAVQTTESVKQPETKPAPFVDTTTNPTTPVETPKPSVGNIEIINHLLSEYHAEVTIWKGNEFATNDDTPPYEVVINFPLNNTYDCNTAKRLSYDILKKVYEDKNTSTKVNRVLITIPNNLRVSLGASDGVPMAENNIFATNGPTNFWKTMSNFDTEDETGKMENRTWGRLIGRCLN